MLGGGTVASNNCRLRTEAGAGVGSAEEHHACSVHRRFHALTCEGSTDDRWSALPVRDAVAVEAGARGQVLANQEAPVLRGSEPRE